MGRYIPLNERTTVVGGGGGGESKHNESPSSLGDGARGRQSVIYKTVKIETCAVNSR